MNVRTRAAWSSHARRRCAAGPAIHRGHLACSQL